MVLRLVLLYKIICDKLLLTKTGMAHHRLAYDHVLDEKIVCILKRYCCECLNSSILCLICFAFPLQKLSHGNGTQISNITSISL